MKLKTFLLLAILLLVGLSAGAQTNEVTYQGKLNDGGVPANGIYDMQFQLYALVAGSQTAVGTPVESLGVTVTDGSFTVVLDFSHVSGTFTGFDRFLGISVKPEGSASYTALLPTQKFTSTPYAIRSQNSGNASTATNATQLGGVEASQYVVTGDSRMSDARQPLPGSADYIQNSTLAQSSSNFNISGDGTAGGTLSANIVSATAGFNLGATRVLSFRGTNNTLVGEGAGGSVLSSGTNNTMVGFAAGDVLTSGGYNSFVGSSAGAANTTGIANSFFGALAGNSNTSGTQNSFFGRGAGAANTTAGGNAYFGAYSGNVSTGADNSFFGAMSGLANTTGYSNSFFGADAGRANLDGHSNSFFGMRAGTATTTGDLNSFFGVNSGQSNTSGIGNSFFGANTGTSTTTGNNNSFFGRSAGATNTSGGNNAFFGFATGQFNATGSNNSFFGSNAGDSNINGIGNSYFGSAAGAASTAGTFNSFFGYRAGQVTTGSYNTFIGKDSALANTSGRDNAYLGYLSGAANTTGAENTFIGNRAGQNNVSGSNNTALGADTSFAASGLSYATAIGSGAQVYQSNTISMGRPEDEVQINGELRVRKSARFEWDTSFELPIMILTGNLNDLVVDARGAIAGIHRGGGEGSELCELGSGSSYYPPGTIATCSSSIRYKEDVSNFTRGVDLVRKLRPVTFTWINSGDQDVGFIAEEVAEVDPLFAVYKDGQIESVKYKQLTTVLVNATMEQQTEIDLLKAQIEQQKQMIESLKQVICAQNPQAGPCKEEEQR